MSGAAPAGRDAMRPLPRSPGLPDDAFNHDGQITKREIRAITLSSLAPRPGDLLWDVGAGSGSVAIEWLLADASNRAVAVEAQAERAGRARLNARVLGATGLIIVVGKAPEALEGLEPPDAVFVGGGFSSAVFDRSFRALKPGGRFVANAVTLETQAQMMALHATHGGRLLQIAIAHAEPVARFRWFRPAMPTVQWSLEKPWD
ncbi:MAG: precorrin-6Y C5,15-methyltransferase (decarboxylating) subunit CbiT [Leifsonia xyli]|nr:MAG: precorrin-6Y C5,15-methyltransferase (decarboxylating) subunit CbiT [Leifsonia xyli]